MADYTDLDRRVIRLGKQTLRMCTDAGSGHPSSSLAIAHLVTALMYRVMRYDPANPWHNGADRLVLSEGHAVPIVYAAYCDLGGVVGIPSQPSQLRFSDAISLRAADSVLDGHPNPAIGMPLFDTATGSLGQGLSAAAGLGLAARLDGLDRRFFCLIGDGEAREGQITEALDFIIDHKLTNVCAIFNCNHMGQSDYVSPEQSSDTLAAKLAAAGFDVRTIDGHNWDEVFAALTAEPEEDIPIAIVANTVKGWGVPMLQTVSSHGKALGQDDLEPALAQLDETAATLGVAEMTDADVEEVAKLKDPLPGKVASEEPFAAGDFAEACAAAGCGEAVEKNKLSTRKAYGVALRSLGADDRIVALDGDVKGSTFACYFADAHEQRFFEAKIAEQNMVTAAAGLAAGGKVPFASTFAKFFVRAYDQVEMAAVSHSNIKLCGSHSGISLAADGPSQMGLCDLAFFRSFAHARRVDGEPMARVFQPSDAVMAYRLTELMANTEGLCYMRTHRPDVEMIYDVHEQFGLEGFKHLIDGEDIAIVASGYMVHVARQAVELLREAGLEASLVDAYAMPLATDEILQIGDDCRGQILVVEDNYAGGFADELTAAAARSDLGVMVDSMAVSRTPKSGRTPEELLNMTGLSARDIANHAQALFDQSEA